jgi:hypothetical protein
LGAIKTKGSEEDSVFDMGFAGNNAKYLPMDYSGCHVWSLHRSLHAEHHMCTFRHRVGTS